MLKQKSTGYTFTTTDYYITEQTNGKDTLTITIIGGSEDSSHIQAEDIIVENNYTDGTEFVVKKVNGDDESIEVTAELNLDDFKSEIYQDYNKTGRPYAILNDVVPDGWVVDDRSGLTNSSTIELDAPTAADVADSVVNVFGVAIRYNFSNHHQIIYNPKAVKNSGQYLTKELNLTGITRYQDSTNLYNRLYAYGKDNLSFANINYDKPYVENTTYLSGRIRAAYVKDERFTDAQSLLEYATEQLNSMCMPTTSYECIPADIGATDTKYAFLQLKLLDVVTLLDVDTNTRVDHQVVSRVIYPYAPENNSLTLSMTMPSFSRQVISLEDQIKQETSQVLGQIEGVVNELTNQIITGSGGHVVINYGDDDKMAEILIMDTDDKATATNVIRMNQAGIAFSTSGYNGPFNGILGLDGTWFASFVNTWRLNAGTIVAGILQSQDGETFYLDLENGILRMRATSLSIGASSVATQQYADQQATNAQKNAQDYAYNQASSAQQNAQQYANQQAQAAQQNAQNYAQQQANAAYQAAQQYAQQQAQAAQQAATEAAQQELEDYADTVTETVSNLQSQIDGQIMTWFESYDPTTSNYPANQWTDNATKQQHAGDLFYNNSDGGCFRWSQSGSTWQWIEIVDTDIAAALATANQAKDVADSKRRVFMTQPTPPYDEGDLWVQQNDGPLMVCINSKQSGSYAVTDWGDAANYAEQFAGAGRNLVDNSAFQYRYSDKTYAYYSGNTFVYDVDRAGVYYIPIVNIASSEDIQQLRNQDVTLSLDINIERTVEADGSHDSNVTFYGVRVLLSFADGTSMNIPSSMTASYALNITTDGWQRVSFTSKVSDKEISSCRLTINNQYVTGKISYRNIKVELGSAPTAWTMHPDDASIYNRLVLPNQKNYLLNTQFLGVSTASGVGDIGTIKDGIISVECDGDASHWFDTGYMCGLSDEGKNICNNVPDGYTVKLSVDVKVDEVFVAGGTSEPHVYLLFGRVYDDITYGDYLPDPPPGEDHTTCLGLNKTNGWIRIVRNLSIRSGHTLNDIHFRVAVNNYATGKLYVRNPSVTIATSQCVAPYMQAPEDMELAAKGELMTQEQVFNKLTDNGRLQGLYMQDGNVYFNASYIRSGTMSANYISGGTIDASKVNVTNLNADNIKAGTITGRAISGGTITGTTITGSSIRSTSNSGSVLIDQGRVSLYDPSGNTLLDVVPGGNNNPANLNFFLPGFGYVGAISCQNDKGLGRIVVTCANNGFFTTNRIQTQEIAVSGSGLYVSSIYYNGNNDLMMYRSGGNSGFNVIRAGGLTDKNGKYHGLVWVYDSNLGRDVLAAE